MSKQPLPAKRQISPANITEVNAVIRAIITLRADADKNMLQKELSEIVNSCPDVLNYTDIAGRWLTHYAAIAGNKNALKILIELGNKEQLDTKKDNSGLTASDINALLEKRICAPTPLPRPSHYLPSRYRRQAEELSLFDTIETATSSVIYLDGQPPERISSPSTGSDSRTWQEEITLRRSCAMSDLTKYQ